MQSIGPERSAPARRTYSFGAPALGPAERDALLEVAGLGLDRTRSSVRGVRAANCRVRRRGARRLRELGDGRASPRAVGARRRSRRRSHYDADDVRRDRQRHRALRCHAGLCRHRSRNAQHRSGRRRRCRDAADEGGRRSSLRGAPVRPRRRAPGRRTVDSDRGRCRACHRRAYAGPPDDRCVRKHRGVFVLRKQKHHDRRRRYDRHGRSCRRRTNEHHASARSVVRRLGAIRLEELESKPRDTTGVQVQLDRPQRCARNRATRAHRSVPRAPRGDRRGVRPRTGRHRRDRTDSAAERRG